MLKKAALIALQVWLHYSFLYQQYPIGSPSSLKQTKLCTKAAGMEHTAPHEKLFTNGISARNMGHGKARTNRSPLP